MRFSLERVGLDTHTLQSKILSLPIGKTLAEVTAINLALASVLRDKIVNTNVVFKGKPFNPCSNNQQLSYLTKWMSLAIHDIATYQYNNAPSLYYDARLIHAKVHPARASWVVSSPLISGSQPLWYPNNSIFQGGLAASQNVAIVKAIYSAVLQVGVERLL